MLGINSKYLVLKIEKSSWIITRLDIFHEEELILIPRTIYRHEKY